MSELLAFKLLEGNSDSFNKDIFSEFKKHNITEFKAQEDSPKLIMDDFNHLVLIKGKSYVKFFSDNLTTNSFNTFIKILKKCLKELTEFELSIEIENNSININEKDDLNTIFEKAFKNFAIYNPETDSYVLYQAKSLNKNKFNKSINTLNKAFKEMDLIKNGWEKLDVNSNLSDEENFKYNTEINSEDIFLEHLESLESKVNIIKKANIVRYLRYYPKLIGLLEETIIEAKRKLGDDSILKLKLNTDENIEYEFLVLTVGNPNMVKQKVFEIAEDLLNKCAEKLINLEGSIVVKPGYRSNILNT